MRYIQRNKCIISDDDNLETLSNIKYPIFCGCTEEDMSDDMLANEYIVISKKYGVIQLKELIPLEILYKNGHDSGAIGGIWMEHHKQFSDFVVKFNPKNVLEIGGGNGILADNCINNNNNNISWTIIEPNPNENNNKVKYIKSFFNKTYLLDSSFDTVVHSHTLEHIYNPNEFLHEISDSLNGGGYMIFSIPNLKKYLENKWINYLSFEHTILLTESVMDYLLNKNQFKIIEKKYFTEHSIFYCCKKDISIDCNKLVLKDEYDENKKLFENMQKFYKDKIIELNSKMKHYDKVYLFGAHIFSQYLIYRGLNTDSICGILDNNINKHNKRLYGTNLQVYSPNILANRKDKVLVILNAGIYNDEIKYNLSKINRFIDII
ncbi:methyltransferase domain-containing protein [Campylobacter jejuni]|uniref:class I SAM-dependent methyltransferase n=1 Tax=Campylobacter jejuni TaxID=197 RepID=UPI00287CF7A1|nr:methyltransferase domain-containing protein [Campylobacter jejuni]ELG5599961.1 methyltransferase domain-containing protein [Campylobacter jejuni]EMB6971460.1 methyltransferase domain-containing protein [Campylobacter jejuni]HED1207130.1 methyltransferase domain-containing protein [Campylobacter jejuni]HED4396862.1 methyltransferase domain-containing protein [Campylobacter jejuni]